MGVRDGARRERVVRQGGRGQRVGSGTFGGGIVRSWRWVACGEWASAGSKGDDAQASGFQL